jgi:hypothetical protein
MQGVLIGGKINIRSIWKEGSIDNVIQLVTGDMVYTARNSQPTISGMLYRCASQWRKRQFDDHRLTLLLALRLLAVLL